MADLEYSASIDTSGIDKGLQRIRGSAEQTTQVFSKLKGVLAGLAIGAVVKNAFELSNAMRDMASATNLALSTVVGFSQAIAANGGTLDRARDGLSDFIKNLGETQNGSTELRKAFKELGVSFTDIQSLSEEDLLRKTLEGLQGVDSTAQKSAIAMRIFGESMKGVDINTVSQDLEQFIRSNAGLSASVDAAGRANQNFKNAFVDFQIALLAALEPISKLAAAILENKEAVKAFIETVINVAKALGLLFVFSKITKLFNTGTMAVGRLASGLKGLKNIAASIIEPFTQFKNAKIAASYSSAAGGAGKFGQALSKLAFIAGAAGKMLLRLLGPVGWAITAFEVLRGIYKYFAGDAEKVAESQEKVAEATDAAAEAAARLLAAQKELAAVELTAAQAALDGFRKTSGEFLKQYEYQTSLITLTESQRLMVEALHSAELNYLSAVAPLQKRLTELKAQDEEVNALAIITIQEKIAAIAAEYNASIPAIEAAVAKRVAENAALAKSVELLKLKEEAQRNLESAQQKALDYQEDLTRSTAAMTREFENLNLTPLQRQLSDVETQLRDKLASQVRTLQSLMNGLNNASIQTEIDKMTTATEIAIKKQQELAEKSYEQQRSFAGGWKKAFESYKDEATNAAKAAERIFDRVTSGMEDAIVGFAKTGKFAFKEFAASVLEDMLRIQARQLITSSLSTIGGMMGGSQGKGLFGGFFATGGFIPEGRFGVVGEAGAEVVEGPANVTPLSKLGQSVTYNINAVDARSFRDLVARDPGFIHAIAMRGGAAIPSGR
jgi:lambda family phage tail tape measure protein